MPDGTHLRRRVVVIDPVLRTREHLRRAVRALGHAPLVFNELEELLTLREGLTRCSILCLGVPHDQSQVHSWVRVARSVVGADVPVLFITRDNPMKAPGVLRCTERDLLIAAPVCFADVHEGLKSFLIQHGIPTDPAGLTWGGYRFVPSRESVAFDDTEIHMRPMDFEIALELFHNINSVLSREWLRSMSAGLSPETGGRWLDAAVSRLRSQLVLGAFEGCEWQLSTIRYGGFKLSRVQGKKTAKLILLPDARPQRPPSAAIRELPVTPQRLLMSPAAPT